MTTIATPPCTADTRPTTAPGTFAGSGRDRRPVVEAFRFRARPPRSLVAAAVSGCTTQFLAPPIAEEERPAPRASDCIDCATRSLSQRTRCQTERDGSRLMQAIGLLDVRPPKLN
jgi:hypothetical protein